MLVGTCSGTPSEGVKISIAESVESVVCRQLFKLAELAVKHRRLTDAVPISIPIKLINEPTVKLSFLRGEPRAA